RRARDQPYARAQVFARDGVRSAALRIRGDSLPVAQVDDRQHSDDRAAQRHDVAGARGAEHHQNREGRFGSVRRGGERIEAEDRDAMQRSELHAAFFAGSERAPEEEFRDGQGWPPNCFSAREDTMPATNLVKETAQENSASHPVVQHLQREMANAVVLYANYKHYHWQ